MASSLFPIHSVSMILEVVMVTSQQDDYASFQEKNIIISEMISKWVGFFFLRFGAPSQKFVIPWKSENTAEQLEHTFYFTFNQKKSILCLWKKSLCEEN